jgi:putative cell wall-binding protein
MTSAIRRDSGIDRYEASRNVARSGFPLGATSQAYIATGLSFPDALSASAAAASVDAPVILVRGNVQTLDAATRQLLVDLGVTRVSIAGGVGSVSPAIEAELKSLLGEAQVVRFGGADRYIVSGAINRAAFGAVDSVYIASGQTFPDALAGAAIAGAKNAPLYVVKPTCVPKYVLQDIVDSGADKVVVLGGTGTLTPAVQSFTNCR